MISTKGYHRLKLKNPCFYLLPSPSGRLVHTAASRNPTIGPHGYMLDTIPRVKSAKLIHLTGSTGLVLSLVP